MTPTAMFGIALILLSVEAFACQGITYTTRETSLTSGRSRLRSTRKKRFHFLLSQGGIGRWSVLADHGSQKSISLFPSRLFRPSVDHYERHKA